MAAPPTPRSHDSVARALPYLVALSGAAALVYESLWLRSFGLIFGGTTSAVAMVLAVFMGGLAIGSALVARRAVADPLRAYARLELSIGVAALVTLPLLRGLPWAYGVLVATSGPHGRGRAGRHRCSSPRSSCCRRRSCSGRPCRSPSSSSRARGGRCTPASGVSIC